MTDWRDRRRTIAERVESLLGAMTLAEKVGQTHQAANLEPDRSDLIRSGGVGSFLFGSGAWAGNVADSGVRVEALNAAQRIAVEESRLGIPLVFARDVIHGHRTVFPIPLGQAATWSPALIRDGARIAAAEAAVEGLHWTFTPMLDIVRDARWGRVAESFGEDPYLCSELARAAVEGYQGGDLSQPDTIAACAKHFIAYGAAEGGRDYNTVDIGPRSLRDTYLPPFQAAVEAGVATVMASFNEIDGVPMTAGKEWIRGVLREEWGFDGVLVSDWNGVKELIAHGVATDGAEAARLALEASVDIDMVSGLYRSEVERLLASGRLSMDQLDAAVRAILRLKFRLGLFERPYTEPRPEVKTMLLPGYREAARRCAAESIVLLENRTGRMPFSNDKGRLLLTGSMVSADQPLFGTWTLDGKASDVVTIEAGIRAALSPEVDLRVKPFIDEAILHARYCDAAIVCLGEHPARSGEANSVVSLELPPGQLCILEALHRIGVPIVAVVIAGRPLDLSRVRELADTLLFAFHPGVEAGHAIADVLFGAVPPCGRLPMSFPRHTGQVPIYYNHKPTGRRLAKGVRAQSRYTDSSEDPLYPFGFGLTTTTFTYGPVQLQSGNMLLDGQIVLSCEISNTGEREGIETVQLYVRDLAASVTRPVRELKGFQRLQLAPGQTAVARFTLRAQDLAFTGSDLKTVVEPGLHEAWIAPHAHAGDPVRFEVTR